MNEIKLYKFQRRKYGMELKCDAMDFGNTFPFTVQLQKQKEVGEVDSTAPVEYRITKPGLSLLPFIDAMLKWGEDHFDIFEKNMANNNVKWI